MVPLNIMGPFPSGDGVDRFLSDFFRANGRDMVLAWHACVYPFKQCCHYTNRAHETVGRRSSATAEVGIGGEVETVTTGDGSTNTFSFVVLHRLIQTYLYS